MKENIVLVKSYAFALKVIDVYKKLVFERREFVLSKQLLRSGTSIGANIEESTGSQSSRDFISKISISYKEARETRYWLRLLKDSGFIEEVTVTGLLNDCEELLRILASIQKTIKNKKRAYSS